MTKGSRRNTILREQKRRRSAYGVYLLLLLRVGLRPVVKFCEVHELLPRVNFTVVTCCGLLCVILLIVIQRDRVIRYTSQLLPFLLFVTVAALQLVQLPWAVGYAQDGLSAYLLVIGTTLVDAALLWLVGTYWVEIVSMAQGRGLLRSFTIVLYIVFCATILLGVWMNPQPLSVATFQIYVGEARNYLMISDAFAVLTLFVVYTLPKHRPVQAALAVAAIPLLYATLSRTTLYVYLVAILPLLLHRRRDFIRLGLAVLATVLVLSAWVPDAMLQELGQSRMLRVVMNPEQDLSLRLRLGYWQAGLDDLREHWLLGRFMAEVERTGERGTYIHNWLSFLVAYGVVPFTISVLLMAWDATSLFVTWLKNRSDRMVALTLSLTIFVVLSVAVSRAYVWPYPWLVLAATPVVVGSRKRMVTLE